MVPKCPKYVQISKSPTGCFILEWWHSHRDASRRIRRSYHPCQRSTRIAASASAPQRMERYNTPANCAIAELQIGKMLSDCCRLSVVPCCRLSHCLIECLTDWLTEGWTDGLIWWNWLADRFARFRHSCLELELVGDWSPVRTKLWGLCLDVAK